jgi:hypothetical protein
MLRGQNTMTCGIRWHEAVKCSSLGDDPWCTAVENWCKAHEDNKYDGLITENLPSLGSPLTSAIGIDGCCPY